jgi:hypothetical protein
LVPAAIALLLLIFLEKIRLPIDQPCTYEIPLTPEQRCGECKGNVTSAGVKVSAILISPRYSSSLTIRCTVGGRLPSRSTASSGMLKRSSVRVESDGDETRVKLMCGNSSSGRPGEQLQNLDKKKFANSEHVVCVWE